MWRIDRRKEDDRGCQSLTRLRYLVPTLIMFVQLVLMIELFRTQFATELLFFVTTLNPLVP